MTADTDGTLEVTVPVRAGSRLVGATFLATNYRPSLDIIRQYDRKSLENNTIPQLQYYPAIGFVRIQGPFNAQRPADSASRRKVFTCRPAAAGAARASCARQILTTLARRAYRRPPTRAGDHDAADVLRRGAQGRDLRRRHRVRAAARCWRARSSWCAPSASPPTVARRAGVSHHRSRARVAAVVLPLEQHPGRRADHGRPARGG